jgi:hypothetical protein
MLDASDSRTAISIVRPVRAGISTVWGDYSVSGPDIAVPSRVSFLRPVPSVLEFFSLRAPYGYL